MEELHLTMNKPDVTFAKMIQVEEFEALGDFDGIVYGIVSI